jgi:hypothetical protein
MRTGTTYKYSLRRLCSEENKYCIYRTVGERVQNPVQYGENPLTVQQRLFTRKSSPWRWRQTVFIRAISLPLFTNL